MRCALPWVLRPMSLLSTLLFLPLWKTHGLGTAMLKAMTMTMMKRLKRSPSEDFAFSFSLFWCLIPKGEKKIYLFSYFYISQIVL
jgi:hypothetical protein